MTDPGQPETPAWVDDTVGLVREDLTPETPPGGKRRDCINDPARAEYVYVIVPHTSAWFQLLERHDLACVGREPQQFTDRSRWLYLNSAGLRVEVGDDVTEASRFGPSVSYVIVRGPADSVAGFVRDLFEVADWIQRERLPPAPKPIADEIGPVTAVADALRVGQAVPDEERLVGRDRASTVVRRVPSTDEQARIADSDIETETEDESESLGLDRWTTRRAEYLEATTLLSRREGLAVAYSERGFSDAGIAKRIDSTAGTVGNYLDRAVAYAGPAARYPCSDPEIERDLERVELEDLADWTQTTREVWEVAADKHPDYAPDLAEEANRKAFPELYDDEDGVAAGGER